MSVLRWIVMASYPFEGLNTVDGDGSDDNPLVSFSSFEAAEDAARRYGLISPGGRRNDAEILAVRV